VIGRINQGASAFSRSRLDLVTQHDDRGVGTLGDSAVTASAFQRLHLVVHGL
jgi:hypothetical protein